MEWETEWFYTECSGSGWIVVELVKLYITTHEQRVHGAMEPTVPRWRNRSTQEVSKHGPHRGKEAGHSECILNVFVLTSVCYWKRLVKDLREGGANSNGGVNQLFDQIFPKCVWKWRKLDREGNARPKFYYVDPLLVCLLVCLSVCLPV